MSPGGENITVRQRAEEVLVAGAGAGAGGGGGGVGVGGRGGINTCSRQHTT